MYHQNNQANRDPQQQQPKRSYPHQRPDTFKIGWDVPQEQKHQVTAKVGAQIQEEPQQLYQQENYYAPQQNQATGQPQAIAQNKVNAARNKGSNIFNAEPQQQQVPQVQRGYGDFYSNEPVELKKKSKKGVDEEIDSKGYGNFYQKDNSGQYKNVPRPAQSTKQQYVYQ